MTTYTPGCIGLVRGYGFLSSGILQFTQELGETPSRFSHTFMVTSQGNRTTAQITEALLRVRVHNLQKAYAHKKVDIEIWQLQSFQAEDGLWYEPTPQEIRRACDFARRQRGRWYGVLKIGLHAIDHVLSRIFRRPIHLARRVAFIQRYPICSWLVAMAYYSQWGIRFKGLPPEAVSPDDIADYVESTPGWNRVDSFSVGV